MSVARPNSVERLSHAVLLDWLRFGAALVVLLCHARGFLFVEYGGLDSSSKNIFIAALFALTRIGAEAVIVFFVLSGYFIAGIGGQKLIEGSFSVRTYTIDRTTRIFVPYLPALMLTWVCDMTIGGSPTIPEFLGNTFGLQGIVTQCFGGNAPLWSLAYEIWFYVLFGFVGYLFSARQGARSSLVFFTGAGVCAAVFSILDSVFLFCWLIGGAAYLFRESALSFLRCSAIVLALMIGTIIIELQSTSSYLQSQLIAKVLPERPVGELVLACGVALLIPLLSRCSAGFRERSFFSYAGTLFSSFSFSLYLIHYPILRIISTCIEKSNEVSVYTVARFFIVVVINLFAAWLFYLATEKHTNYLRRRIIALTSIRTESIAV